MKHILYKLITTVYSKIYYFGFKYKCNVCNKSLRKFYSIGESYPVLTQLNVVGGGKREAGCPFCNSTDRERLLKIYLEDFYKVETKGSVSVLHIAPEAGLIKYFKSLKNVNYSCGDKFTQGYTYPSFVKNMDVLNLPFDDNKFDLVLCNHVLEHIVDDKKAMSEIFRVLKSGGQALLQVPFAKSLEKTNEDFTITDPKIREQKYGQFDHVRLYGLDYIDRLKSVGFNVSILNVLQAGNNKYLKNGINSAEDLFIIKK